MVIVIYLIMSFLNLPFRILFLPCAFLLGKMKQNPCWGKAYARIHTQVHTSQNKTESTNTVKNILYSIQIIVPSNTQRRNSFVPTCWKKKIRLLPNCFTNGWSKKWSPQPREHNVSPRKQSSHACKKSRKEEKKSCQKQQSLSFPSQMSLPTDH